LIKEKIGTSDKEKIQKFYSTLHQSLRNPQATQLLDDVAIARIQALILEQRELDEASYYNRVLNNEAVDSMPSELYNTSNKFPEELKEYFPLRWDMGDTQKLPPMNQGDYEEFIDDMEDKLLRDIDINEGPEALMSAAAAAGGAGVPAAGQEEVLPEEEEGAGASQADLQNQEDN
jgi:hypothetical protein